MSAAGPKVRTADGPDSGLPDRLGEFLRARHPHHTVKSVQQVLAAIGHHLGPDTVKNWVQGDKWPTWPVHLDALLRAYGQPLADEVFGPSLLSADQLEEQRIARLEAEAALRRARLDAARQNRRSFLGKN